MLNTDVSAILTNGETQDVFRGGQGEAKLPCVMTDDLCMQHTHTHTQSWHSCMKIPSQSNGGTWTHQMRFLTQKQTICAGLQRDIQTAHLFVYQPQCILDVGVL